MISKIMRVDISARVEIRPILIVVWQIRCKNDIMVAKVDWK